MQVTVSSDVNWARNIMLDTRFLTRNLRAAT